MGTGFGDGLGGECVEADSAVRDGTSADEAEVEARDVDGCRACEISACGTTATAMEAEPLSRLARAIAALFCGLRAGGHQAIEPPPSPMPAAQRIASYLVAFLLEETAT